MHWTETEIHVIDFEGNRQSGILEYGIATMKGGEIRQTATRLCRARGTVPDREIRIHGIRREDTLEHPPLEEDWEYFAGLRATGPFAAHSASVENALLKNVWPVPRLSPDWAFPGRRTARWGPWIDSRLLCRYVFGRLPSEKLEDLVAALDLGGELEAAAERFCPPERRRTHCALHDALASALLIRAIGRLPDFSGMTLPWLLHASAGGERKRSALRQDTWWGE